jgi:hypothetical protein
MPCFFLPGSVFFGNYYTAEVNDRVPRANSSLLNGVSGRSSDFDAICMEID